MRAISLPGLHAPEIPFMIRISVLPPSRLGTRNLMSSNTRRAESQIPRGPTASGLPSSSDLALFSVSSTTSSMAPRILLHTLSNQQGLLTSNRKHKCRETTRNQRPQTNAGVLLLLADCFGMNALEKAESSLSVMTHDRQLA
jgi:hypothetical protein